MQMYKNIQRYGSKWNHVLEVTTHEMERRVRALPASHPALVGHEGGWALGKLASGGMPAALDAMRNGIKLSTDPFPLPGNLTAHCRPRQAMVRRPSGPLWNVPRLIQGDPRPAFDFQRVTDNRRRMARIAVSCFTSGFSAPESYARRGQAIASLLQALKRADFEIEASLLYAGACHDYRRTPCEGQEITEHKDGERVLIEMAVHKPGRILDPKRIATIFGHIAIIRGVVFSWREAVGGWESFAPADEAALQRDFQRRGWLFIPNNTEVQWHSEASARQWVREALTTFGVLPPER